MVIPDYTAALRLTRRLTKLEDHGLAILELATAALSSSLAFEVDLDLIGDDYDVNDFELPSIEHHDQNQHREGVSLLVRLMADTLAKATAVDPDRTVRLVGCWPTLPGRTGLRLYLHALRSELFDADTAMQTLLDTPESEFWTIRREVPLLLRDRAGDASPPLVSALEDRIRETAERYYDRYSRRAGEPNWRPHARDVAVWLRLTMLEEAGVLSNVGVTELRALRARRNHLARPVEDRDFFDSYVGPVQTSFGNPSPIEEAPPGERLERAREVTHSQHPEFWQGWHAFSSSNPAAALEELLRQPSGPEYGAFWDQFLRAISFGDDATNEGRRDLATRSLERLVSADDATLSTMVAGLCDLLLARARQGLPDVFCWVERLWPLLSASAEDRLDLSTDPLSRAINSPAGRLTEALLFDLRDDTEDGRPTLTDAQRRMLTLIATDAGDAARLGRVVLARFASFLTAADRNLVTNILEPPLSALDGDGAALRSVLLTHPLSPQACRVFAKAVKRGALEAAQAQHRKSIAANLLRPALADVRNTGPTSWGLSAQEVADVLREGPPELRSAALQVLWHWIGGGDTLGRRNLENGHRTPASQDLAARAQVSRRFHDARLRQPHRRSGKRVSISVGTRPTLSSSVSSWPDRSAWSPEFRNRKEVPARDSRNAVDCLWTKEPWQLLRHGDNHRSVDPSGL